MGETLGAKEGHHGSVLAEKEDDVALETREIFCWLLRTQQNIFENVAVDLEAKEVGSCRNARKASEWHATYQLIRQRAALPRKPTEHAAPRGTETWLAYGKVQFIGHMDWLIVTCANGAGRSLARVILRFSPNPSS